MYSTSTFCLLLSYACSASMVQHVQCTMVAAISPLLAALQPTPLCVQASLVATLRAGGHRPQHPYEQGLTCAKQEQAQAVAPWHKKNPGCRVAAQEKEAVTRLRTCSEFVHVQQPPSRRAPIATLYTPGKASSATLLLRGRPREMHKSRQSAACRSARPLNMMNHPPLGAGMFRSPHKAGMTQQLIPLQI